MARESELSVTLTEVNDTISTDLGFGPDYTKLDVAEMTAVDSVRKRGERQAYNPPPLGVDMPAHQWSFLKPIYTFDTVDGQWEYDLPPEYSAFEGPLTFTDDATYTTEICYTVEAKIRAWRAADATRSGVPCYYSIQALAHDMTHGQRHQLIM